MKKESVTLFSFRLPVSLHTKIRIFCVMNNISMNEFVLTAVKKEAKERGIR